MCFMIRGHSTGGNEINSTIFSDSIYIYIYILYLEWFPWLTVGVRWLQFPDSESYHLGTIALAWALGCQVSSLCQSHFGSRSKWSEWGCLSQTLTAGGLMIGRLALNPQKYSDPWSSATTSHKSAMIICDPYPSESRPELQNKPCGRMCKWVVAPCIVNIYPVCSLVGTPSVQVCYPILILNHVVEWKTRLRPGHVSYCLTFPISITIRGEINILCLLDRSVFHCFFYWG